MTGEDAAEGVRDALEIGYRQIDTARADDNERDVGRGIADRVSNFPVAYGRVPDDQTLRWIGESPSETADQVALRLDQRGVSPIPTASSHEHRRENFEVFDFDLSQAERDEIDLLPTDVRTANPPWAPDWNA